MANMGRAAIARTTNFFISIFFLNGYYSRLQHLQTRRAKVKNRAKKRAPKCPRIDKIALNGR
jgi:hypothetical protein